MKKQILCIVVAAALCLSLAACARGSQEEENTLLEYPGVSWEATPEEVIQAMGFPAGAVQSSSDEDGYNMGVEDWDCFGVPAQSIVFRFHTDESGRNWLYNIEIVYPEDADMGAVRQAMEAEYGEYVDTYTEARVERILDGAAGDTPDFTVTQETVAPIEGVWQWVSPTAADYFPDDVRQTAHTAYAENYIEIYEREMTEEEFSVIWENTPLVRVSCTEVAFQGLDFSLPDYTSNMVSFDANYLEHFRSFGDTQLFDGDTYAELLRSGAPQAFDGETAQKLVGTGSEAQPFPIEVYENLAGQSGEAVPFPMEIYGNLVGQDGKAVQFPVGIYGNLAQDDGEAVAFPGEVYQSLCQPGETG